MRQVVDEIRMPEIELPSRRVVTIALFGNRQRHDPGLGRGQSRLDVFALIAQKQNLANAADDSTAYAGRAFFHRGIYAALRREAVADVRGAQPDDSPVYAAGFFSHRGISAAWRREPVANVRGARPHAANAPVALIE